MGLNTNFIIHGQEEIYLTQQLAPKKFEGLEKY